MQDKRVVLITGASSGIGRATAQLLAESGFRVFGTSRHPAAVAADGVEMLALDVTDDTSVARCIAQVLERAGRLDALINNAGVDLPGSLEEVDNDSGHWLMEINFFGVARVTRAALPHLRTTRGHVVIIGSGLGLAAIPFEAYYNASKHALEGLAESLRYEVWPFGIRVSLVEPGFIQTDILRRERRIPPMAIYEPHRTRTENRFNWHVDHGGDPANVARTVRNILNDRSPRLRYTVGPDAAFFAMSKRFVPYALFETGVRVYFGLFNWRKEALRMLPVLLLLMSGASAVAHWLRRGKRGAKQ